MRREAQGCALHPDRPLRPAALATAIVHEDSRRLSPSGPGDEAQYLLRRPSLGTVYVGNGCQRDESLGARATMPIALPGPIAAYFAAEGAGDAEALARCFAEHSVVRDEGGEFTGVT